MKVRRRKARPGETFLGGSGIIIPRGIQPSIKKTQEKINNNSKVRENYDKEES